MLLRQKNVTKKYKNQTIVYQLNIEIKQGLAPTVVLLEKIPIPLQKIIPTFEIKVGKYSFLINLV
ncbi:hypothetical protein U2I54_12885 [Bacillus pseudomycoides]|uniref:Uncharacterized protein n=1 Tax=Bacillus bingmayongensis TaxID=1150157 RepID=A0ABU5JX03_9BACI|nr:hypothetical protein [Bacillus pseudomycoides]